MPTYIARPDNTKTVVLSGGGTNPAISSAVRQYLGDNLDSTFVTKSNNNYIQWAFALTAPSIPSDEFVCRIGTSIRWKGGGNNRTIGGTTYRQGDTFPTTFSTLVTDGRATITTTEVGVATQAWSIADTAIMRYAWYDQTSTALTSYTYELLSTVYTLKRSTAVPTATTMTNNASPVVPVQVTNTVDWEAGTIDSQGLRKITVELRVEANSSTGAGTTAALSEGTLDYYALATGTDTVTVTGTTALPNATYKMYARAIRHREDEISVATEQIGAWSTAATLTMSTPLPGEPFLFTATGDPATDKVTLSAVALVTGSYTNPKFIDYERSDDGGTTWTAVRDGTGVSATGSTPVVVVDYEAPRGYAIYYRSRIRATFTGGFLNTGPWSSGTVTVTIQADKWNLKVPQNDPLNVYNLRVVVDPQEDITEDVGVFRPLDRRYPVVVAGKLGGWDGEFTIATITTAEWDAIKALVEAQRVLLLQSPFGWEKYIRIINGARTLIQGTTTTPRRQVTFQYVEVNSPN
jgi:hypothetical protein